MVPDYQSDLLLFVKNENQQQSRVTDVSNNIMLTSEVNYVVFHTFIQTFHLQTAHLLFYLR